MTQPTHTEADSHQAQLTIEAISEAMHTQGDLLWERGCHASVIDSCMENVSDLGYSEADPSYWPQVLDMLKSELDSFDLRVLADGSIDII